MSTASLTELDKERRIGAMGTTVEREIPVVDMTDFEARPAEIGDALWHAASEIGFFQLSNHGIPQSLVDEAFEHSARYFAQDHEAKAAHQMKPGTNVGWEFKAQVRPSTGTADRKESYQITRPRMDSLWPTEGEVAGFRAKQLAFERANWELAMRVLSCFAERLGFERDFFAERHDPESSQYQSTLRLIHYLGMEDAKPADFDLWRAGAHTDFDVLTLLHQRPGQGGLQLCPGNESGTDELAWTDVPPLAGVVTCNIGDMLMRWSDDRLLSTLHRVRMPDSDAYLGPRYSIAFFAQANKDAVIEGPDRRYEAITAHDYLQQRIAANFAKVG